MQLAGTGNLAPLGRQWLAFCVVLIRLGYTGIRAPMWAIARAHYRACGQSRSERTAYRGLALLEKAGFLKRQKLRLGPDHFASVIRFNLDRFKYWTGRQNPHIAPYLPKGQETEVTSKETMVNSRNPSPIELHKPAPDRDRYRGGVKNPSGKGPRREHPIVYTLRCITRGPLRRYVIARAVVEITSKSLRTSGVNWAKWIPQWTQLTIAEREHIAREQIRPYLVAMLPAAPAPEHRGGRRASALPNVGLPAGPSIAPQGHEHKPPSPKTIAAMLSGTPIEKALKTQRARLDEEGHEGGGLSPEDRAVLEGARLKAKRARGNC